MEPRRRFFRNGFDFSVSGQVDRDGFSDSLMLLDAFIRDGVILKNSKTTTAAVCEIPGCGSVFVKRTNRKGIRFILRYLFRRARSFRAAKAIDRLAGHGIETPEVLAVGEYRTCWILQAGYLLTEFKKDARNAHDILLKAETPEQELERILNATGKLLANIHLQKVLHGDFKLQNIYFLPDGTCGAWDLDGARISTEPLTLKQVLPDLRRLHRSVETVCKRRKFEPAPETVSRKLAQAYTSVYPVFPQDVETALRKES